ncbi:MULTISPECIES: formate dehydrogenase subunit gamma [unclassified Ruegeria]|uniref:formate dehydrogenase subunit gamma n=1 Tax=unclassified Ruegeria TaxID=2625375 RepID=UPI001487F2C5|nr:MULTISPECIES: formate dehydrogenase subunit gamma [unclassified Ruegeria]NOD75139.1 formate dehydrogenase subunit gamma [Ruegeria sp. HKCCD4332]NOD87100.1 formate dehydrogenase subunit gamma [Ruegeria sp. HKCCD4318]NOE12655.1 formate dehydrogenase subunit gamma [Ruegeria sp. HKCCD4318-2]NOG09180.1 formate dehydrogenase subunit gamma [Ruegeria sp. HKCCD4315]
MFRLLIALLFTIGLAQATVAQTNEAEAPATTNERASTGGATTLEDILARQRGEKVDNSFRSENTGQGNVEGLLGQFGPSGVSSDSDVYRALRFGSADVTVSSRGPADSVLIQDGGMWWWEFRTGPLREYGGYIIAGMLAIIVLFFLIRGKIRIDGEKTGRTVLRFTSFERFGHWLFAGSFVVLAITGLLTLYGRDFLIPIFGKEGFATIAQGCKWLHNNLAWAFMLGLIIITVNWIAHNIPNRTDLKWLAAGGGLFSKNSHPPAKKFNAGQKIIFWACILLGVSISLSGLSLLFPFELPMFAKTFSVANATGIPQALGLNLPVQMSPQEEMQYAQIWHVMVAYVFIAIIIAHIYLGSVGMEGAFDAMGSGEVEEQWAREHHSLWLEEVQEKEAGKAAASPAE